MKARYRVARIPLLLSTVMLLTTVTAGRSLGRGGCPVTIPGGVADLEGRIAFVVVPQGGVEAIAIDTGRVWWSRPDLAHPLSASAGRLIALAGGGRDGEGLHVEVVDATKGGRTTFRSKRLPFPEWAVPGSADFPFSALVARCEGTRLLLTWRLDPPAPTGAALVRQGRAKERSGGLEVDLETGQGRELRPAEVRHLIEPDLPEVLRTLHSAPYLLGGRWETAPLVLGGRIITFSTDRSDGRETMRLNLWEPGPKDPVRTIRLFEGESVATCVTTDRRSVFIHDEMTDQPMDRARRLRWIVYSLESFEPVTAELAFDPQTDSAAVVGSRLLYAIQSGEGQQVLDGGLVSPRTLTVVDAWSGRQLWQRPIAGEVVGAPQAANRP